MAINKIDNIYCSLNLGYVYDFSYEYDPKGGVKITIYFVNESGIFDTSNILNINNKVLIKVGSAIFNMYALDYTLEDKPDQKTLGVNFIDDTFLLNNYYLTLTNKGCGVNVFNLGKPIDTRTAQQQQNDAVDPTLYNIRLLTQFQDIEYHFSDFLAILQKVFPVTLNAVYNDTLPKTFSGTFREVLDSWCSYFNLAYYFENGVINIVDPTQLNITLPSKPAKATTYTFKESLENTYNSTAYVYFNQEGGQFSLPATASEFVTLYPVGFEFDLDQQQVDLNQVVAAMYGEKFWLIYNIIKGTAATECGWQPVVIDGKTIATAISELTISDGGVVEIDTDFMNDRYDFYKNYGEKIAGRYYLSNDRSKTIFYDKIFSWYDNTNVQYTVITDSTPQINIDFIYSNDPDDPSNIHQIDGTQINQFYPGVNYFGNRIVYVDNFKVDYKSIFTLTDDQSRVVDLLYSNYFEGIENSSSLDYSEINTKARFITYQVSYVDTFPLDIATLVENDDLISLFKPRNTTFSIQGVTREAVKTSREITTKSGPIIQNNVGTIETVKGSQYNIYYATLSICKAATSNFDNVYARKFFGKEISVDTPVIFHPVASSPSTYTITRDLSQVSGLMNSSILQDMTHGNPTPRQTVNFSINYFDSTIPTSFISNGLTSLSVSITNNGVVASYAYSNAILEVPANESLIDKIERDVHYSYIRKYNPFYDQVNNEDIQLDNIIYPPIPPIS